ncbi:MAG TPA: hypothetical protein VFY80_02665 [Burkholderiales bacterium]|nr:hypothetical protein [Burkholderiales bacterium]
MPDRKHLAQSLRDDAAKVRNAIQRGGEEIARRMDEAADLLDGRAEKGIEPPRAPDA